MDPRPVGLNRREVPMQDMQRWECYQCARIVDATADDYCPVCGVELPHTGRGEDMTVINRSLEKIRDASLMLQSECQRDFERQRRQRRLDLARVVWLIAVLSMALVAVAAVCLSK
jgi:hypothetical protein